jgi:hypothetical protein
MGAVIKRDPDTHKEQPLGGVEIAEVGGLTPAVAYSDSSGFFSLRLAPGVKRGDPIKLEFRHPEYRPFDLKEVASDKIYVAHLTPLVEAPAPKPKGPEVVVSNVSVRYATKVETAANVGSAVKTFEVVSSGNVPCNDRRPCSPDGKWKAAVASTSLDAGTGNEFRNIRVSRIAGPCPFTRVVSNQPPRASRTLEVTVHNWSETTVFLVEAEVFHPMISNIDRQSYPVIFGPALNFSLPALAEGLSIHAEIDGQSIIFPLGPKLNLSWASCSMKLDKDQARVYRCELKPGYRFG